MTPLYEALKRGRPELTITVATRGLGLEVLRHSPFVDDLIATPDPLRDISAAARSISRQLTQRGLSPDCVVTGIPDQRTRIALAGILSCDGWRGGFTVQPGLYQRPLQIDRTKSQIANNLQIAELLGCRSEHLEPRVFYTSKEAGEARALLREINGRGAPVLIVVSRNSGGQRTGWHDQRWTEVLQYAQNELGFLVVYAGVAADEQAIEVLRTASDVGVSIAGRTSIPQLAALLACSDLMISLDTGTMHVGRASGLPMVVLGPSWQKPHEWLPLGKEHVRILRGEDRTGVPEGYLLDEISAEAAMEALRDLALRFPASEDARERRRAAGLSEIDLLAT